ncbi:unnamed protein product [Closterium sp. Naga37s-1]|nr:unnamed protein product [Closterium sp. Naga37s-1]
MGASARRGVNGAALPKGNELCESVDTAASVDTNNGAVYSGDRLRSIFAQGTSFSAASERPWSSGGWGVADGAGDSVSERGDAEREDIERRVSYSSSIAGAAGSVVSSSTAAYTETAYSESLIIQHTDRDTDCESVTSASSGSGYDALAWAGSAPMGGVIAPTGGENAPLGGENATTEGESALMGGRSARLGETLADGGGGDFATLWRSLPRDLRRTRSLQSPRENAGGYPGGNAEGGFAGESRGNGGDVRNGSSRYAEGADQGSYVQQGSMRRVGSAEMLPAVAHESFVPAVTGAAGAGPLAPSAHSPPDLPPPSPRSAGGAAWVVSVPSFAQHRLRVASAERAARGGGEGRGAGEGRGGEVWRGEDLARGEGDGRMPDQRSQQDQQQQQVPRVHRRARSLHSSDMEAMRLEQIGEFSIPSFQQQMGEASAMPLARPSPSAAPLLSPSLHPRGCLLRSPRSPRLPSVPPRAAAGTPSVPHPTVPLPTPQHSQNQLPLLPPRAHRRTRSLHAGDMEWMRLEQIDEFTIPSFHHPSPSTLCHSLHSPSAPLLSPSPSAPLLPPSPSALRRSPSLQSRLRSPRSPRLPPLSPRVASGPLPLPRYRIGRPFVPRLA